MMSEGHILTRDISPYCSATVRDINISVILFTRFSRTISVFSRKLMQKKKRKRKTCSQWVPAL